MSSLEPIIVTTELTKRFDRFTAVDRLSLTVDRGEIFGFLGPNGAGKSTTIRMLCGILASTSGTATVGGFDINRNPDQVRQTIGYMSQRFSLYRDLTVAENIRFFGGVYGLKGANLSDRMQTALRLSGLEGSESALTGTLSGAIQQRLALGCAILHQPPILFLDEPTSGVDPVSRRMFWDVIQNTAAKGVTILVTTHFLDEAEFCGRVGLINSGKLVALGTPTAVKHSLNEDLFEVATPELTIAASRIRDIAKVLSVSCFGNRLHVFCERNVYTHLTLADAIQQRGITARRPQCQPSEISLEDAFVRLVERSTPQSGGEA
jgi:ABC-2 type transport system ATP-binding protein